MTPRRCAFRPAAVALAGAALFAALVGRYAARHPAATGPDAAIVDGAAAETMAGTTPGRQALVSSAWWGPLPLTGHLAAFALARPLRAAPGAQGVPLAVITGALLLFVACLTAMRHPDVTAGFERTDGGRPAVLLTTLGAVLPGGLLGLAAAGSMEAWIAPLGMLLVLESAAWLATGRLRHAIATGFAMAALLLCGAAAWGWVAYGALAILLGALARRALIRRLPGLLLLGWLPAVYAAGVWLLFNWLIMGDGLFFLRALATLPKPALPPPLAVLPEALDRLALATCLFGAATGLAARDGRRIGYGLAGLAAALWIAALHAVGLGWSGAATRWLLHMAALLGATRCVLAATRRRVALGGALQLALLAALLAAGSLRPRPPPGPAPCAEDARTIARVTEHVRARTTHPRVFVCGYEGLGLLRGQRHGDLFVPVLDLHLESLRRDYWGQPLFVLVRRPLRAARLESIAWREPDFHRLGSARTLLAADFEDWRLYEIVDAPTHRELLATPAEPHIPAR